MQIYVIKNGQQDGPYTEKEVLSRLESGFYNERDLVWFQGCDSAVPMSQVLTHPVVAKTSPPPRPASGKSDNAMLIRLAIQQKVLIALAIICVVLDFTPLWPNIAIPIMVASWLATITGTVLCLMVAWTMRKSLWLWGLISLIPFVNLFAYAKMVSDAAVTLKANGISTGIFGVNFRELDRLRNG